MSLDQVDKSYKILILGESGVRKSSIFRRILFNNFEEKFFSTIGRDVGLKKMMINELKIG